MIQGERETRDNEREMGWIDRDRGLGRREKLFHLRIWQNRVSKTPLKT